LRDIFLTSFMELKWKKFKKKFYRLLVLWMIYKYPILSQISVDFWCYMFIVCCVYLYVHQYDLLEVCYEILILKTKEYFDKAVTHIKNKFK
jgi:hypothetical protein